MVDELRKRFPSEKSLIYKHFLNSDYECELMKNFQMWSETQQVNFVKLLLSRMQQNQQSEVSSFLNTLLSRDFISLLPDHVAENILSYLDPETLCQAELVCKQWRRTISEGMLWKKTIKRQVELCDLWRNMVDRRDFNKYLFAPYPEDCQFDHMFYKNMYYKIFVDVDWLNVNWMKGRAYLKRIRCRSASNRGGVYCVQADNHKVIGGTRESIIKIWDSNSLDLIQILAGHTGSVLCLQFDAKIIVSGSTDCTVRIWDIKTGEQLNVLTQHTDAVLQLRFRKGRMVTCSKDRSIVLWNMATPSEITVQKVLYGHRAAVNTVDFDEKYIVSGSGDRTIRVWHISTYEFVRPLVGHTRGIACLQYKAGLVVSGSSDNTVRLWDIDTGECLRVLIGHLELVRCLQFDSKKIISGSYDGEIRIWDLVAALNPDIQDNKLCIRSAKEHQGRVFSLHFDQFQIVSSATDDTILIWDFLHLSSEGSPATNVKVDKNQTI